MEAAEIAGEEVLRPPGIDLRGRSGDVAVLRRITIVIGRAAREVIASACKGAGCIDWDQVRGARGTISDDGEAVGVGPVWHGNNSFRRPPAGRCRANLGIAVEDEVGAEERLSRGLSDGAQKEKNDRESPGATGGD